MKVKLIEIHPDKCVACDLCEIACSFHHEQEFSLTKSRIKVLKYTVNWAFDWPIHCTQCAEASCIASCPVGALHRDESTGVVVVDTICNGCGECITACPIHALDLDEEKQVILKCDLCSGDPECVKWCDRGALILKEDDLDSPARKAFMDEASKKLRVAGFST